MAGLLVCAIDGTIMPVADSAANLAVYAKHAAGATETPSASGIYQAVTRRGRQCGVGVWPHRFRHHFSHTWLERGGPEGDLMELNGWSIPQMLARYGASARSARARRTYDRVMTGNPCALALDRQSRRARTDGHRDTKDPPFWH